MKKSQIIQVAIQRLEEIVPYKLKIKMKPLPKNALDGKIEIVNTTTKETIEIFVEVKNEVRQHDVAQLIQLQKKHKDIVLLANYISKPLRELLKARKINYLESTGNCYIHKEPIFIYINNQIKTDFRKTATNKLRTYGGMKFLYALLRTQPSERNPFINSTYRDLATAAEVSLGSVGNILEGLEEEGFVATKQINERLLIDLPGLFDYWANNFGTSLRPHLLQIRMRSVEKNFSEKWVNMNETDFFWGGEPAAWHMDKFLVPEQFTIYTKLTIKEVISKYKMVPDIGGNILIMLPPLENAKNPLGWSDPYLTYAELIQSKDSRCLEAAQRIKDKYIVLDV